MTLATWKGISGINAFWPLGGMQVDAPGGVPRVRPAPNTYLFADGPGNYGALESVPDTWHFRTSVLAQIVAAGFDHVRLQYEPTPLIWAILHGDNTLRDFVLTQFDICIDAILGAGLGVMLSGILAGYADLMPPNKVFAGSLGGAEYMAFRDHLALLGNRYSTRNPEKLAIEIFNEPPGNGSTTVRPPGYPNWGPLYTGDWQTDYQPALYSVLRTAMPRHTIVLTCDGWSNWEVLGSYDPTLYLADSNVLWTYHPLEPTPVSLAGYVYNQYFYTQRMAYPPGAHDGDRVNGTLESSIAHMEALVDRYPDVQTGGDPEATKAGLRIDLQSYYGSPEGYAWIKDKIKTLSAWARRYGIPPGNLYAGEYGVTRDSTGFPGNILGTNKGSEAATRLDRIHCYRDMTTAIIVNGHRRAPDHLDTLNYGITTGKGLHIGPFDPRILGALATRRGWLAER